MMGVFQEELVVWTGKRGFVEITDRVADVVSRSGIERGVCVVFCRHTSAGLVIQENADRSVRRDLLGWFSKVVRDGDPDFEHVLEGPDDMAAHIRTVLTGGSETVPVADGELVLGTWQGIYLVEHRLAGHDRRVFVHVMGE